MFGKPKRPKNIDYLIINKETFTSELESDFAPSSGCMWNATNKTLTLSGFEGNNIESNFYLHIVVAENTNNIIKNASGNALFVDKASLKISGSGYLDCINDNIKNTNSRVIYVENGCFIVCEKVKLNVKARFHAIKITDKEIKIADSAHVKCMGDLTCNSADAIRIYDDSVLEVSSESLDAIWCKSYIQYGGTVILSSSNSQAIKSDNLLRICGGVLIAEGEKQALNKIPEIYSGAIVKTGDSESATIVSYYNNQKYIHIFSDSEKKLDMTQDKTKSTKPEKISVASSSPLISDTKIHIQQNPFFILEASMNDNRKTLLQRAEDQSLLEDADVCESASTQLTNVKKRMTAEISWFPGTSDKTIKILLDSIGVNNEPVCESLNPISRLNYLTAVLENLRPTTEEHLDILSRVLIELDQTYSGLNADEILGDINRSREIAEIPQINSVSIVESELSELRSNLKSVYSDTLSKLSLDAIIKVSTFISEKYANARLDGAGILIEDILGIYEIKIEVAINEQAKKVKRIIASVTTVTNNNENPNFIPNKVNEIIVETKEFDRYAQPLQLLAQEKGTTHKLSEEVGYEVRELAIDLHNNCNLTEESLKLSLALEKIFAELPRMHEKISEDVDTLKDLNLQNPNSKQSTIIQKQLEQLELGVLPGGYLCKMKRGKVKDMFARPDEYELTDDGIKFNNYNALVGRRVLKLETDDFNAFFRGYLNKGVSEANDENWNGAASSLKNSVDYAEQYLQSLPRSMRDDEDALRNLANGYKFLATCKSNLGIYGDAYKNFSKASDFYRKLGDISSIINCYRNMGKAAFSDKNYSSAIGAYDVATRLYCKNNNDMTLHEGVDYTLSIVGLGYAHLWKNNQDTGLMFLTKASTLLEQLIDVIPPIDERDTFIEIHQSVVEQIRFLQ